MLNTIAKLFFFFFPGSTASRTLDAGKGSFAFTGHAANLTRTEVEVGGYSSRRRKVRVKTPVVRRTYTLQAEASTYAFEGVAARLGRGVALRAGAGVISLNGSSATLGASRVLRAGGGVVAFVGRATVATRHAAIVAEGGRYAATGSDAIMIRRVDTPAKLAAEDDEFLLLMEAA
jgi:hypothetical protein